jgi:hypothetical protein
MTDNKTEKYLIPCNLDNHQIIKSLLDVKIISQMNNYDGTYDYIIMCSDEFRFYLQNHGVNVIADKKLDYKNDI